MKAKCSDYNSIFTSDYCQDKRLETEKKDVQKNRLIEKGSAIFSHRTTVRKEFHRSSRLRTDNSHKIFHLNYCTGFFISSPSFSPCSLNRFTKLLISQLRSYQLFLLQITTYISVCLVSSLSSKNKNLTEQFVNFRFNE